MIVDLSFPEHHSVNDGIAPELCHVQLASDLVTTIETCAELGLPLSLEKREGPTTVIEFLGIELDTELMEIRLPEIKLISLRQELERWTSSEGLYKEAAALLGRPPGTCM